MLLWHLRAFINLDSFLLLCMGLQILACLRIMEYWNYQSWNLVVSLFSEPVESSYLPRYQKSYLIYVLESGWWAANRIVSTFSIAFELYVLYYFSLMFSLIKNDLSHLQCIFILYSWIVELVFWEWDFLSNNFIIIIFIIVLFFLLVSLEQYKIKILS